MRLNIQLLALCLAALGVNSQQVKDGCPKDEYACLDVINSSQCLGQLVEQNSNKVNADSLAKCVVYDGTVTSLPGGTKVSNKIRMNARDSGVQNGC
jgi:hypothetical protein